MDKILILIYLNLMNCLKACMKNPSLISRQRSVSVSVSNYTTAALTVSYFTH